MKLVTFEQGSRRGIGAVVDDGQAVVDFAPHVTDILALIDGGDAALDRARALVAARASVLPLASVRLLAPLPEPRQMRDFVSFEKHLRQARANRHLFGLAPARVDPADVPIPKVWYEQPACYKCNRFAVVGTETEIIWPRYSTMMDYELEIGCIIGRRGKDIPRDRARDHIFGYLIFNDFSARDAQMRESQIGLGPAKGKDFDTGNAMGPWLVTADDVPDPYDLTMVARVNGVEWSRGNSGTMHHRFEDMIAHVSADETLHPGEFLGAGTVGGGCGLELGRFLAPGDVVELEITGLGVLRNRLGPRRS